MNTSILIVYNIRRGILNRWIYYLSSAVIFFLLWLNARSGIQFLELQGTIGDYLLSAFSGQKIPGGTERLRISGTWLCIYIGFLHSSLSFLGDSMNEYSMQVCIRSRRRSCWWLAMYLWSAASTLTYFLVALATVCLLTILSGGQLTAVNSPDFTRFSMLAADFIAFEALSAWQVGLIGIAAPLAFAMVLGLLQLCLSLFISPVQSFLACIVLLIASCYYYSPLSLGSYAMAIRSEYIVHGGLPPTWGLGIFALLAAALYLVGSIRTEQMDFLPRNREKV